MSEPILPQTHRLMPLKELEALREALKECSDELAEWVGHHYEYTMHHPSEKRRYDRDMEPVLRARALLKSKP